MKKSNFTDEELTRALERYEDARLDAQEGQEEQRFSPGFERRMDSLLHRRRRRTSPALRWAATAAVLALLLTPLLPQARALPPGPGRSWRMAGRWSASPVRNPTKRCRMWS